MQHLVPIERLIHDSFCQIRWLVDIQCCFLVQAVDDRELLWLERILRCWLIARNASLDSHSGHGMDEFPTFHLYKRYKMKILFIKIFKSNQIFENKISTNHFDELKCN